MTAGSLRRTPVAIVGGGFAGTMVAAHLARREIDCVLIEGSGLAGTGAAFSTSDPAHLLNVPASNMSAWRDSPADFAEGGAPGRFAQRRHFGAYLRAILESALASGHAELAESRATAAHRTEDGWRVSLADGGSIDADALVLANGLQPPAQLPQMDKAGDRLVANPWSSRARTAIEDSAETQSDVLIVGTGLTMVDVVLSLDSAGHRGRIVAVSRRGLLPKGHAQYEPSPVEWDEIPAGSVRDLTRWLRQKSRATGWRAAVDSLRPHSHRLWQSLPSGEQERFLRHARPWWDVHRHRIAPEVAQKLSDLLEAGRLQVVAGRLESVERTDGSIRVVVGRRGGGEPLDGDFGWLFNCTGPLGQMSRSSDPLLRQMLDDGLVAADPMDMGIAVDARSRIEGSTRAWAIGALTKGRYWEIIAVPDIRNQAADVAEDIATELGR